MTLTRERLLYDLYCAYYEARRHKGNRSYVRQWAKNLKQNMEELCDELYYRRYKPLPSKCFIVNYPKKREIFAAIFRDRIVHHLYFCYTHELFERTFIQDSYSCIKKRGTLYGIQRVTDFCRRESQNWQLRCYVLHLDIRGYFMHIVRQRLLDIAIGSLRKMAPHRVSKDSPVRWQDRIDIDFIEWLTEVIVMLDPKENCIICGSPSDWEGLDPAKSLLSLEDGLGLPIGNLTSQLFSNVYLNLLDQYVKRVLKCRCYGRYVDDAVLVSTDKEWLLMQVPKIRQFLQQELKLELHMGKLAISEIHQGAEFLGTFIKAWRNYISNHSLARIEEKMELIDLSHSSKALLSLNSYLGILQHTSSYNIRRRIFMKPEYLRLGVFNEEITKITNRHSFKF